MDKRQKILDTTIQLITRQGFHATPMSQVAREAEVAAGTIYHYFSSKDALIQAVYTQTAQEIDSIILSVDDASLDIEARFYEIWLNIFRYFISRPEKFLFLQQFDSSPFQKQTGGMFHSRIFQNMHGWFQQAREENILADLPDNLISALMYSQLSALVQVHIFGEANLDGTLIEKAMRSSWKSVLA